MTTGRETGATFNASIEGLNWKTGVSPSESSLKPNTVYTFWVNFTTNTSLSSIAACKFELLNNNSVVLATISGCLGTGGIGGNISTTLNTSDNRSIRMRISVDMGSGYWIIDADSFWLVLTFDYPTRGTLKDFITYSKDWSIWGDGDRGEISRVLAFFLIFTIVLGFLSYTTNWDLVTGGGNIMLFLPVIWFASAYGFFNLSYQPENVVLPVVGNIGAFMNRYTIALFASMLSLGYLFNKIGDGGR
jgi:hypothetical protein